MRCRALVGVLLAALAAGAPTLAQQQLLQQATDLACPDAGNPTGSALPNCVQLGANSILQWAATNDTITFNHTTRAASSAAQPLGWMGLGLSETGSMKGADMVVLQLQQPGGDWQLTDRWAAGFAMPEVDQQQDVVLLGVRHQPARGLLSAVFRRHLVTCDAEQDLPIKPGQELFVQHAWGGPGGLEYHGRSNRGATPVVLVPLPGAKPVPPALPAAADTQLINISLGEVVIPSDETTYYYTWFKAPTDRKYHVVSYGPLLGSTGDRFAHHAVVYGCPRAMDAAIEALPSKGPIQEPGQSIRCTDFYMLTTPWSAKYEMPPEAGLPIGDGSYRHLMLEVHFNNPAGVTGVTDAGSGVTLLVTPRLRPADLGLITLTQAQLVIPPGLPAFSTPTSLCNSPCTRRFRQPIHLVHQTFHMHGLGKSAVTRRWRNGTELEPLGQLRSFDYRYQGFVSMPQDGKVLMPGDELAFTCTFNSTSRTNVTTFGPGTRDEMCFHWIYYWPNVPGMGLLFAALRDPRVARAYVTKGLPYNVTIPSGTPFSPPACASGLPPSSM